MKWFHAIGICGKATGNVAKMFKDMGWFVTGSDLQYFPPMSDQLKSWQIPTAEGYHYTHLTKEFWSEELKGNLPADLPEVPNLCLAIDTISPLNKEYLFAKKRGIDVRPYAQILGEFLVKPESIVVIGTAGKTTTTTLLVRLLQELNLNPSYMVGAEVIDFSDSLKNTQSNWSILEGDEFHNPEISNGAKFLEYKPKYLIITNIGWEHQDIFKTQESYIEEFAKAVESIPEDGLIIAHANSKNIDKALMNAKARIIRYGKKEDFTQEYRKDYYFYNHFTDIIKGEEIEIFNSEEKVANINVNLFGEYNMDNTLAAFTLVYELIETGRIQIKSNFVSEISEGQLFRFKQIFQDVSKRFKGPKKRLEVLFKSGDLVVVDDFGVTPNRAVNSLKTLKEYFPKFKVIAIFEPNSGSRISNEQLFNEMYKDTFKNADQVIIPELSTTNDDLIRSDVLVSRLINLNFNAKYIPTSELLDYLKELKNSQNKVLIVFFSSYRLTELARKFAMGY